MATTRACEHCGGAFIRAGSTPVLLRAVPGDVELENTRHEGVSSAALDWSLSAMTEASARLARSRPPGAGTAEAHAVVAVSDAVLVGHDR